MNSNRYGESRAAYREVQERHEDIKSIEANLGKLARLFNDVCIRSRFRVWKVTRLSQMSVVVEQQDDTVDAIDIQAGIVQKDMEAGYVLLFFYTRNNVLKICSLGYTEKAVASARAARKKRWICFFIILILLIIVAIVVAVVVTQNVKSKPKP